MEKKKILYVSQEICPYMNESAMGTLSSALPQLMQESGKDIRIFLPRFGTVNERRHQLHEVIRLSGMNLIIDDFDHQLIIKVASIQQQRMQVYFIDNEEYFKRKAVFTDDNNKQFKDNDERSLFFCRGVLEAVKKLGWAPDIIHCHGWMASLLPVYIKEFYNDDPIFSDSKIVYSVYGNSFKGSLNNELKEKLSFDGICEETVDSLAKPDFVNLNKAAISFSDGVVKADNKIAKELESYLEKQHVPILDHQDSEEFSEKYEEFYSEIVA